MVGKGPSGRGVVFPVLEGPPPPTVRVSTGNCPDSGRQLCRPVSSVFMMDSIGQDAQSVKLISDPFNQHESWGGRRTGSSAHRSPR
jgi:hypothetical protein